MANSEEQAWGPQKGTFRLFLSVVYKTYRVFKEKCPSLLNTSLCQILYEALLHTNFTWKQVYLCKCFTGTMMLKYLLLPPLPGRLRNLLARGWQLERVGWREAQLLRPQVRSPPSITFIPSSPSWTVQLPCFAKENLKKLLDKENDTF